MSDSKPLLGLKKGHGVYLTDGDTSMYEIDYMFPPSFQEKRYNTELEYRKMQFKKVDSEGNLRMNPTMMIKLKGKYDPVSYQDIDIQEFKKRGTQPDTLSSGKLFLWVAVFGFLGLFMSESGNSLEFQMMAHDIEGILHAGLALGAVYLCWKYMK